MERKTRKGCFKVNNEQICEGDTIIQTIHGQQVPNKFKSICGGYVIIEGWYGLNTLKLTDLKKRLTGAKYELIKK